MTALEAATNNLRDAGVAIRMIRDAVQELGPVGCVKERDVGPPDYAKDAEEIVAGIQRLAHAAAPPDLLLAAKEAAVVIAKAARAAGADPHKGTCLPRLMAAIARAEGRTP